MQSDVAALYVDRRGPYPKLLEHWYDQRRDATKYAGPWPIVAHWCAGSNDRIPDGIRIASAEKRKRTPTAFAQFLIAIAARCAR